MKRKNDRSVISNLVVFVLTISLLTSQSLFVFGNNERNSGEITVSGAGAPGAKPFVLVNGEQAFSGRTFFSNGTISTTESSSASIDFGRVGRITLEPNSTLTLSVSGTEMLGTLSTGAIKVANGDGVSVKINTPDDAVANDGTTASRFAVNVVSGVSTVAAESGTVTYNNGKSVASRQDDDDDDDDGNIWIPIVVIGGAVGAVILFTAFDDDDEIVSPIR